MPKSLFLFVLLTYIGSVWAQETYPPRFLIPYNDHGQWGYCDTLGMIRIPANFEEADYFSFIRMNEKVAYTAKVKTDKGTNYISETGDLLFPKDVDVQQTVNLATNTAQSRGFLVEKDGKLGIYRAGDSWHVHAMYDSISWLANMRGVLLLKKADRPTFDHIDNRSGQVKATDISELGEYFHNGSIALLAKRNDGDYYELMNGKLLELSETQAAEYESLEGLFFEEMAEMPPSLPPQNRQWYGDAITAEQLGVDRLIDTRDFTNMPITQAYGFVKLIIASKNGQQGVLNEAGVLILPFQYDRIKFMNNGTQAELWQGDQQGYKLFLSPYPTIEPAYNRMEIDQQFYISNTWKFTVFSVQRGDQRAYVGENGVTYFEIE